MIEERTLVDGGQTAESIASPARRVARRGAALARHRPVRRAPARGRRRRGGRRDPGRGRAAAWPCASPSTRTATAPSSRCRLPRAPSRRCSSSSACRCGRSPATPTSCTTSTWCATWPRCGRARRTGRSTRGRARRTCSSRWPRRASRAPTRATSTTSGRRGRVEGSGSFDTAPVDVGGVAVRAWFSPGRGPELSHRIAERIGGGQRRVRIASPVLTAAPILAALNQALAEGRRRRRGRVRRDPGRAGLRAVARERELGLEGAAARARALRAAVVGQGLHAVRAGRRPRLHAREGHGRRRRRLRRLVQPLALGRGERRERARDRRRRAGRADGAVRRRRSARATRRSRCPAYAAS